MGLTILATDHVYPGLDLQVTVVDGVAQIEDNSPMAQLSRGGRDADIVRIPVDVSVFTIDDAWKRLADVADFHGEVYDGWTQSLHVTDGDLSVDVSFYAYYARPKPMPDPAYESGARLFYCLWGHVMNPVYRHLGLKAPVSFWEGSPRPQSRHPDLKPGDPPPPELP